MLGERHLSVSTVDAAGAGVGQMFDLVMPARFKQVGEGNHVAFHVGVGVLYRVAHSGLGGQVDNPLDALLGKAALYGLGVGQVFAVENVAAAGALGGLFEDLEAGLLDGRVVVVVDYVKPHYVVAALEQCLGDVKTDEACVAGDQSCHSVPFVKGRAAREPLRLLRFARNDVVGAAALSAKPRWPRCARHDVVGAGGTFPTNVVARSATTWRSRTVVVEAIFWPSSGGEFHS